MAVFFATARRLSRRADCIHLLFSLLQPTTGQPLYSSSSQRITLSYAFHRTLSILSKPLNSTPQFRFHCFSTQVTNYPFEFTEPETETETEIRDNHDPGLLDLLKRVANFDSEELAMAFLDESGTELTRDRVYSVIWKLRENWRLAYLAFKWGEKCNFSDKKVYDLMVWVLGSHKKFNIAWCLIRDMYRSSTDTRNAMIIMIERYAAANDISQAFRTFDIMEKFRLSPDEEAFHMLLRALCKHGNIEEAEEFMLANRKLFPLTTEGFNIILSGYSSLTVDIFEAKRIWREMSNYCITPNSASYTHMISCFSKVENLFDSLRLYDEMKKRGWVPTIEVYNSLVYVLTCENCLDEALKLLDKMKETGLKPDSATYNSIIRPLCKAGKLEEAKNVLAAMVSEKLSPNIDTFHAFLSVVDFENTLEVLKRMRNGGCCPNENTFLIVLERLFKLEQPENALKVWGEMERFEVVANYAHYTTLVHGLVKFGWLVKAREFYSVMISNGFLGDPKLEKLVKEPARGNSKKERKGRRVTRRKQVYDRKAVV